MEKNIKRELISGWSHLFAGILSVIGLTIMLLFGRMSAVLWWAVLVYGISLAGMFFSSAIYHLNQTRSARTILILRKIDHSAIYFLIAGSYTPICIHFFNDFFRYPFLLIIWGLALLGVGVKIFVIQAPRWVTAGIYLIMGWLSITAIQEMLSKMPGPAILWLVLGGVFYTVGAVIYMKKKPDFFPEVFGFHELWHLFVIFGAFSHFVVVLAYIANVF